MMPEQMVFQYLSPRERFDNPSFRRETRYLFVAHHAYMTMPLADRELFYDARATHNAIERYLLAINHATNGKATSADRDTISSMISSNVDAEGTAHRIPQRFRWVTPQQSKFLTEHAYVLRVLKHMSPRFEEFIFLWATLEEELLGTADKLRVLSPYRHSPQFKNRTKNHGLSPWGRVKAFFNDRRNRKYSSALYARITPMREASLLGEALYLNKIDDEFRREFSLEFMKLVELQRKALTNAPKGGIYGSYFELKLKATEEMLQLCNEVLTLDKLND